MKIIKARILFLLTTALSLGANLASAQIVNYQVEMRQGGPNWGDRYGSLMYHTSRQEGEAALAAAIDSMVHHLRYTYGSNPVNDRYMCGSCGADLKAKLIAKIREWKASPPTSTVSYMAIPIHGHGVTSGHAQSFYWWPMTITYIAPSETWTPFDEPNGDKYLYKDWYVLDASNLQRVWRQNWRKGERCTSGASLGLERNVENYFKDEPEIKPMGDPSFWEYFDVMVRNWYDAGDWAPLASTVAYGQVFTQTKVQKQDWQKGERCTVGPKKGETRNVIDYTKERLQTQTTTGLAEEWEPFDIPVGGWYDTSNWTPDPSTIPHGQAFTQTKTQRQNWRKGERCIVGPAPGTERNVVPYPRDQTITQSATGTQEIWNQVYWWTDWYPITDWEPADLSKVPVNTTVTQTMHFRRDQFMKEVSNLNNIRNDQTYIQSEFRSETRQAQGTQPLPTDATVKVKPKAPEVKVQNSQTKGGAQISVEDKK